MIDHDRLFKELLSTFLLEFIDLLLPEMMAYIEPESITFLDKEVFTDVTAGDKYETDLIAKVQFRGKPFFFLIHIENQASAKSGFGKRIFRYFARLHEKYDCPVYPIVVFSYDKPKAPAPNEFKVDFPDFSVLQFNYRVIQLNQLSWRDFINQQNPVAAALMSKMRIAPEDRAKVKVECLRLLVTLKLDPARMQLISGFVDTYLRLTPDEESEFAAELIQAETDVRGELMEIVTSWQLQGREAAREEARQDQKELIESLLTSRLGQLPMPVKNQIAGLTFTQLTQQLGKQVLTLASVNTLADWLNNLEASEGFTDEKAEGLSQLRTRVGAITPKQKQKLLTLSPQQWRTLSTLELVDADALDTWLASAEN